MSSGSGSYYGSQQRAKNVHGRKGVKRHRSFASYFGMKQTRQSRGGVKGSSRRRAGYKGW